jgi:hypothetical protein
MPSTPELSLIGEVFWFLTMVRHINFVGRFDLDFSRKPPFELRQVIG